jgi:CBS domain containing-hemolysin-like protein
MNLLLTSAAITFFLLIEIFFSGSEIALVVVDKVRLKARMKSGHKGAAAATWFIKHPAHFFSTVILGTNISVVAASTFATFYLISNFGEASEIWALLLSPIVLIFGEVLPKSLFQHYADKLVERISPPLMASMYAIYPLVWVLSGFTRFLLGGVEHHFGSESRITREELAILMSSADSSDVKPSERKMVSKILELTNHKVKNIMVPLALIESIPVTAKRETALNIFDLKGFSKLPVFETKDYNIVGVLDCMDCLFLENAELKDLIRPVLYISKNMNLQKLYLLMKEKEQQIAIVVDEYGASVGLITMEDLLEEIVGDIKDEYEIGKQHWHIIGSNHFLISGRAEIEEVNEKLGLTIPAKGHYETIAGFLLEEFGRIPLNGEEIKAGEWRYIIKDANAKAILEVEVTAL